MATPLEQYQQQYTNSQAHQDSLKWNNATIQDVANKYGFNFSKDYAAQQANLAAQGQLNQYNDASRQNQTLDQQTLNQINGDLKKGVVGTENTFFQNYLQQRQAQANRGINAGIVADQNLRLGMNQQGVLGQLYADANNNKAKEMDRYNNESQKIKDSLALVEQQRQADTEKMYQDLLTKGYGMLGTERGWYNTLDQQAYGQSQDAINNWYQQQQLDLQKQAAARAAAAKAAQDAAAAAQAKAIQDAANKYKEQQQAQFAQTPIAKYYNTPAVNAVESLKAANPNDYVINQAFKAPVSVANNLNLQPWQKMQMLFGE